MMVKLLPLTLADSHLLEAVAVYNEYVPGDMRFQQHFFRSHMERKGYVGLVARLDDQTVGFAFGSQSLNGQWWHECIVREVGRQHPALNDAWVLTQLNVLAAYRNRGVGTQLHDAIIERQLFPRLLLSTPVRNRDAQRFYLRHGWQQLHPGLAFSSGDEPYMIFHRPAQLDTQG